jgi:hypothetical protein
MDRFATATIQVALDPISRLPAPFNALRLDLSEHFGVLGDSWMAAGPQVVARRASGLMPTAFLQSQSAWLRPVLAPLGIIEPALSRLCFGLIEPELVPVDRLSGVVGSARQPGEPGCH